MNCTFRETAKQVFYRNRTDNKHRKVGNLADFCEHWGSQYEHMIVLDADSIMTGQCMLELTTSMINNPNAGLIQTIPIPVRQEMFFGRFLQFASVLYSPMLDQLVRFLANRIKPTIGVTMLLFVLKPLLTAAGCLYLKVKPLLVG